jgi:hypothetical protein
MVALTIRIPDGIMTAMDKDDMKISVLVFKEKTQDGTDWWVAQCLEYDLATQARSLDDLSYEIQRLMFAHIVAAEAEGLTPFECLPPAPRWYHDKFNAVETEMKMRDKRIVASDRRAHRKPPRAEVRIAA